MERGNGFTLCCRLIQIGYKVNSRNRDHYLFSTQTNTSSHSQWWLPAIWYGMVCYVTLLPLFQLHQQRLAFSRFLRTPRTILVNMYMFQDNVSSLDGRGRTTLVIRSRTMLVIRMLLAQLTLLLTSARY